MELTRISSHLVALATGGMELGALTGMTAGFREREEALHLMEFLTGLRMNMAFIRPGGVAQDFPEGSIENGHRRSSRSCARRLPEYDKLLTGQPIWKAPDGGRRHPAARRLPGSSASPARSCARAGLPWDLRKVEPYCGYEEYDFEVPTATEADCYARFLLRVAEMHESLKIMSRPWRSMRARPGDGRGPRRSAGRRSCRSARDGMGNSLEHVRKIMGQSMESLIHHFKLVTEGFEVPAGPGVLGGRDRRAASWAATWSPTAAPGRGGCTCATPAS